MAVHTGRFGAVPAYRMEAFGQQPAGTMEANIRIAGGQALLAGDIDDGPPFDVNRLNDARVPRIEGCKSRSGAQAEAARRIGAGLAARITFPGAATSFLSLDSSVPVDDCVPQDAVEPRHGVTRRNLIGSFNHSRERGLEQIFRRGAVRDP